MTFKAGSSKKFNIFLIMLISALENTSSAVIIDLETHNDLEKMRNKPVLGNTNTIYLILTYLSEFDKVYYPLPLQLKVEDNHLIGHFQKEIFELNNNLNLIIKEKEDLFEENNKLIAHKVEITLQINTIFFRPNLSDSEGKKSEVIIQPKK